MNLDCNYCERETEHEYIPADMVEGHYLPATYCCTACCAYGILADTVHEDMESP